MSQKKQNPTLIVGAGLAGICIAYEMHKRQIPFQIIDSGINVSTDIAAGIINPIVFRRVTTSWRAAEFIPEAKALYAELSAAWGNTYYKEIPIRRAFSHQQEIDLWMKKQELPEFKPYLKPLDEEDEKCNKVINTFGTGKVYQSGYVEASLLLQDGLKWLEEKDCLRRETFNHAELNPETGSYQGQVFEQILFCEGYQGIYNPWFSYLPLEATKGEVLTVESKGLTQEESINRKCFVMPIGNHRFRVGATYEWNTPNTEITEEGKNLILENFQSLTNEDTTILSQRAGIRPTTLDRRPLIGSHCRYEKLKIFNGLGAKGFLIAPLLAKEFVSSIETGEKLDKEINIERYNRLLNKD
jgi:glycine oxidase